MKIIHWLNATPNFSGLHRRVYSMWEKGLELGQDRHIAFSNHKPKVKFITHTGKIGTSIEWEDCCGQDVVNIFHVLVPPIANVLHNKVAMMHGTPKFSLEQIEYITSCGRAINTADLILTSWRSHVPYWQAMTDKPVELNRPGTDCDYFTADGTKKEFTCHPTILFCDAWRDGKDPYDLLFAMKTVGKASPEATLKLIGIADERREMLNYLIGRLGLDNIIEYPIEGRVDKIREYYRGADLVYCASGTEGNNVLWEASACGKPVILPRGPVGIANQILEGGTKAPIFDVKDTVKEQVEIFNKYFKVI